MANTQRVNRNGKPQGMHPNSRVNLEKRNLKGNNHAKKDCSITPIQREMMGQLCPYAKDPTWTWAYALAEAGMRDALTDEKARENLKDRIEGRLTLPVSGAGGEPLIATFIFQMPDGSKVNPAELLKRTD